MRNNQTPKRHTVAVIVDGETEMWYFQMLQRNEKTLNVAISPKIPQKKKLSDQFDEVKKQAKDYDKVFWVVDLDVILKEEKEKKGKFQTFEKYRRQLEKYKNVVVIVNNPCLEFWFLLHFQATQITSGKCVDAENSLKTHIENYKKERHFFTKEGKDIYLRLKPNLKTAIENAKRLGSFDGKLPEKSVCEMHLFFEAKEFKSIFGEL
ncbi:MAG: hypothetical protein RL757_12 [Bacteroidota bacterium]|jgi:hypothetical protein